jgi:hypothetical protein
VARIRTIKPEFFLDDELAELPMVARILFIGLWTIADCEGRMEDRPKRIKAQILPFDDCDIDGSLQNLHDAGFVQRYEAGGGKYIVVTNFRKHQRLSGIEAQSRSVIPPPGSVEEQQEQSIEAIEKQSRSTEEAANVQEGKGKEGKGKEWKGEVHADPDPSIEPEKPKKRAASAAVVFDPIGFLADRGVEKQTIADHFSVRKLKKQPPTETALLQFEREAAKAGVSMQEAATECCARGWGSFKAEWLTNNSQNGARAGPAQQQTKINGSTRQTRIDNYWNQRYGDERSQSSEERDITGESERVA